MEVSVTKERIIPLTQEEQQKRPFEELLTELASYPEFQELLNKMSNKAITAR